MSGNEFQDMCVHALFELTLAHQTAFDAAVRELRQKRAAFEMEERRLLDQRLRSWAAIEKANRQLTALGCSAPDVIEETDAARGCAEVMRKTNPGREGVN